VCSSDLAGGIKPVGKEPKNGKRAVYRKVDLFRLRGLSFLFFNTPAISPPPERREVQ
jgi:hypothetical protein